MWPLLKALSTKGCENHQNDRDGGRFEFPFEASTSRRKLTSFRVWRTMLGEDAPGPERNQSPTEGVHRPNGVREGNRRMDRHRGQSVRVRGDNDQSLPHFIVETDGTRAASSTPPECWSGCPPLNEIGRSGSTKWSRRAGHSHLAAIHFGSLGHNDLRLRMPQLGTHFGQHHVPTERSQENCFREVKHSRRLHMRGDCSS